MLIVLLSAAGSSVQGQVWHIPERYLQFVRSISPADKPNGGLLCNHRHHKRRIVQPNLVTAIASRLGAGGYVYLSSDVHEVRWAEVLVCSIDWMQVATRHNAAQVQL